MKRTVLILFFSICLLSTGDALEIKKGATLKLPVVLVDSTDHITPKTGVTSPTVYYLVQDGSSTQKTSPIFSEVDPIHMKGLYQLTLDSDMTGTPGKLIVYVTKEGCDDFRAEVDIVANLEGDTYADVHTNGVKLSVGTGTGQIALSGGAVTVGTNNDKTGYATSPISGAKESEKIVSAPANYSQPEKPIPVEKNTRQIPLSTGYTAPTSSGERGSEEIVPTPTYYRAPNKSLLDEKTRGIAVPDTSGTTYGVLREKRVMLKLDTSETYDSNIYLTKDNIIQDFITTVAPGIYAYIGNDRYTAMAFYEADVLIYGDQAKQDRINQTIGARADLFKQSKIKVSLQDAFRPTTDPATSEISPFVRRMNNDFTGNIRYDMSPRTSMAINYEQYLQYYITEDYKQFSYLQHTVSPVFYYHLTPKLSVTGEYNLGITNYMGGANYNSLFNQARLGLEGVLTPKSRVYLRAGYQYRRYYNSDTKNVQTGVLQLGYDYNISPKTTLNVIASSDINESVWSYNAYYNAYNFYAALNHHLRYNLDLSVNGLYILSVYPHDVNTVEGMKKRSDSLYGVGAKISYYMRTWLSAYAAYDFKFRNSDIRDVEYEDNLVSGGLKLSF